MDIVKHQQRKTIIRAPNFTLIMKTKLINTVLFSLLIAGEIFAQDVTTVRANSSDISDNLDLQAVASIFGDSQDLEDFEHRLNDPDAQISNLDLNNDNRVDYLRVIEVTEKNTHVIILQSVLAVDTYQDVATIEVERDRNNNVTVQVVGDSYIYGNNYIYEPVYVTQPAMFNVFWVSSYRPYYSPWYYGYYPTYYSYWAPYTPYRYRYHVHNHINYNNSYHYVNTGRSTRAQNLYATRSANAYARQHPNQSFTSRNANVTNRHQLEQTRSTTAGTRGTTRGVNANGTGRTSVRNTANSDTSIRNNGSVRSSNSLTPANGTRNTVRSTNQPARFSGSESATVRTPANNNNGSTRFQGNAPQQVRSSNTVTPERANNTVRNTPAQQYNAPSRVNNTQTPVRSMPAQSAPAVRSMPAAAPSRSIQAPAQQQQRQAVPAATSGGRRG